MKTAEKNRFLGRFFYQDNDQCAIASNPSCRIISRGVSLFLNKACGIHGSLRAVAIWRIIFGE